MTIGERIRAKRQAAKLSQAALGEAVGVKQATVSDWENGVHNPARDQMPRLAEKLKTSAAELEFGAEQPLPETNALPALNPPEPPLPGSMPRDIPIMGTADGGGGDRFVISGGDPLGFAPRPPSLAGRSHIFAIYVQGESMVPWRKPGEAVYIDERRAPYIGDHVLVKFHSTEPGPDFAAVIKRLVKMSASHVILAQYNPAKDDIRISREKIAGIYRVIENDELLGV